MVWYLNYQDVIVIGYLLTTGSLYTERVVALVGPQVKAPSFSAYCLGADSMS